MSLEKININCKDIKDIKGFGSKKDESAQNVAVTNNQEVVAPKTVEALKSLNNINTKDYIILQKVNIPLLNVQGNLYQLKNGQKCLLIKKDGPCVIKTYFKVGSMNEPDNLRGISHFIEHNLFNGSKNLKPTEFVANVNERGGRYNASTGFINTNYFIESPLHDKSDFENFIKIHADMLASPTFTEEMLAKEKGPVISEIQMLADNPFGLASNVVLKNLFNIKTNSSDLIGGSVENIRNLTRNDVVDFYKSYYNPKSTLTVVTGDIDEDKTLNLLSKNFADFKYEPKYEKYQEKFSPVQKPIRADLYSSNTQSAVINLAFVDDADKQNIKYPALPMLLYALSGYKNARLTKVLKKMNIDVCSDIEKMNYKDGIGAVMFSTVVPDEKSEDVLKLMYEKIHNMAYEPLSNEELQVIKNKMINGLRYVSESNFAVTDTLAKIYMNKNSFSDLENAEKLIKKITKEDIMNAAKKILDLNKVSIAVVHPKKDKLSFKGAIKNKFDINTYKTPNNIQISTLNLPKSKLYALEFILQSDKYAAKTPLAKILNSMLSEGTSLMPTEAFYDIEDKNSIISSIENNSNEISLGYSFPKESLDIVLDNLNKNLFYPQLTKENFEKAKQNIRNLYLSVPKSSTDRAMEVLYENTPNAALSLRKVVEDIDSVNYDDVINYYNDLINNGQCKVVFSGDLTDKNILNKVAGGLMKIDKTFLPVSTVKNIQTSELVKNKVVAEIQDRNQADIVRMFRIKETGNVKDKAGLLLLNEILGGNSNSRLFNDLREKQKLAYKVNSNYSAEHDEGVLSLRIFTTTDDKNSPEQYKNLQKAINGFKKHINLLINEKVSEKELEAAKLQIKSKILFNLESVNDKNSMLSTSMQTLYKEKYLDELLKAIDEITPENLSSLAQHYLTKPSVISIVASKDTLEKNNAYLKELGDYTEF